MTMHIQVINPKESPDQYKAKVTVLGDDPAGEEFILEPGEVSPQICIYDGKYVKIEELEVEPK